MDDARNLPRLLTREQAASYCGLTPSGFASWMAKGRIPKALPGSRRWDRKALDIAIDAMSGVNPKKSVEATESSVADRWFRESGYEGTA